MKTAYVSGAVIGALCLMGAATAPAFAQHHPYRDRANHDPYENQYNYQENLAFTQGCPPGAIPESFPSPTGRRCALPNGGYIY